MKYKLVRLNENDANDARFIKQGLCYKLVHATEHDCDVMEQINALVKISRNALRGIYSGNLSDEEFDAAMLTLSNNDTTIQRLANEIGIEMSYLNPWADGRGFVEE